MLTFLLLDFQGCVAVSRTEFDDDHTTLCAYLVTTHGRA
jgi:hypothetical protein